MTYIDLTGSKKINGLPADIDTMSKLIDNDAYFKNEVDTDEDLEALDRNITPIADDTYSIGELANRIKEIFSVLTKSERLQLSNGTPSVPAFSFTGETTGFYRSAPGQISFVSGLVQPFVLNSSGIKARAANNTQITIESSSVGFEDTWGIGGDLNGLHIFNSSAGLLPIIRFFTDKIQPLKQVQLQNGSLLEPALSFSAEPDTGLYKDSISSKVSWVIGGVDVLSIDNNLLQFYGAQIMAPNGDVFSPSYVFEDALDTGISALPSGELVLSATGSAGAKVHQDGFSPYKVKPVDLVGPQLDVEIDVSDVSKLVVDCTAGDVSIIGLTNAEEGQILHIIMAEDIGVLTIKHDDLSATSSLLLKGKVDFVINADYGGIMLSYDGGVWREAGRS